MQSGVLEYRAKLVELIYSTEQNMLMRILREADPSQVKNGHALAAYKIVTDFKRYMNNKEHLESLPISRVREIALALFNTSMQGVSQRKNTEW